MSVAVCPACAVTIGSFFGDHCDTRPNLEESLEKEPIGRTHTHTLSLSVLTAIFPGEHLTASFIGAKDDGPGGDNWSCKTCKAAQIISPTTNQHPTLYRPDALAVQPTMSKH